MNMVRHDHKAIHFNTGLIVQIRKRIDDDAFEVELFDLGLPFVNGSGIKIDFIQ
jgi:hypothetical protein